MSTRITWILTTDLTTDTPLSSMLLRPLISQWPNISSLISIPIQIYMTMTTGLLSITPSWTYMNQSNLLLSIPDIQVNLFDKHGYTPLGIACNLQEPAIISTLIPFLAVGLTSSNQTISPPSRYKGLLSPEILSLWHRAKQPNIDPSSCHGIQGAWLS